MITSIVWLPRGVAAENPSKYLPTDDEVEAIRNYTLSRGQTSASGPSSSSSLGDDDEHVNAEIDSKYGFDDYDDDDDNSVEDPLPSFTLNEPDPYIIDAADDSEDEDDRESQKIRPTDDLIVVSNVSEGDVSTLEIYIYEAEQDNLFQHHEILLPSMPLCVEWMNFTPSTTPSDPNNTGNIVAVGSFLPAIELWNLDVVDCLEPMTILGARATPLAPGSSISHPETDLQYNADAHKAPVLALSWNGTYRQLLASGSADNTVKLWDLSTEKVLQTMRHHKDKVQALKWNPRTPNLLLSGGYDRKVFVIDPKQRQSAQSWAVTADIECVAWNPHDGNIFLTSTEDGRVNAHDIRQPGKRLFTVQAHSKEVTGLSFNPRIPNLFLTASTDKSAKVWAVQGGKPHCLQTFNSPCGKLFSAGFSIGAPFVSALGGTSLEIVNTAQFESVQSFIENPSAPINPPSTLQPVLDDLSGPVVLKQHRPKPRSKKSKGKR